MESKELDYSRIRDANNNNNEDSEYYLLETSCTTPGPSCCASEEESDESDYNDHFYELIQRMQSLGKNDLPIVLQVPGRVIKTHNKYLYFNRLHMTHLNIQLNGLYVVVVVFLCCIF